MTINTSKGAFLLKKRIVCGEDKNYLICTQGLYSREWHKELFNFAKKKIYYFSALLLVLVL